MRIGVGGIFHETNTYGAATSAEAFQKLRGAEIVDFSRGARTYLGGLLDETHVLGFDAVPLLYAEATPSGTISNEAYRALRDELVELAATSDLDGLLLSLHGAGVAQGVDSIEEDIVAALRERLGDDFPIVATLDLHGNIRQPLGDLCNALFPVKFNPHTDQHERGVEAARCIAEILLGHVSFDTSVEQVPLLFPPIPTSADVFVELEALCAEMETKEGVLCARIMHGFPYVDVPHIGASVVAVTRKGTSPAAEIAKEIAAALWNGRDRIKVEGSSPALAVREAISDGRSQIVINEFSDNTGAGAPGDGTHLLSELIAADARACFSHVFDPQTVAQATAAGVGAKVQVTLGARRGELHGTPIKAEAEVLGLNNGLFRVKSPMGTGETIDLGALATLRIGSVDIIVSSGRRQTLDNGWFIKAGVDIEAFPIVALKSSQHFRAWFGSRSQRIITADSPGLSPVDVGKPIRKRLERELWPIAAKATYPEQA